MLLMTRSKVNGHDGLSGFDYGSNGAFGVLKPSKSIDVGDATVTPFISTSHSQIGADQAKEGSGGDFNYTISDATAYSAVAFIRGELSALVSFDDNDGWLWLVVPGSAMTSLRMTTAPIR